MCVRIKRAQQVWTDTRVARSGWEKQNEDYKDARKAIFDRLHGDAEHVLAALKREIRDLQQEHDKKVEEEKQLEKDQAKQEEKVAQELRKQAEAKKIELKTKALDAWKKSSGSVPSKPTELE